MSYGRGCIGPRKKGAFDGKVWDGLLSFPPQNSYFNRYNNNRLLPELTTCQKYYCNTVFITKLDFQMLAVLFDILTSSTPPHHSHDAKCGHVNGKGITILD